MVKKQSQRQDQYDKGRQLFIETAKYFFKTKGYDQTKISDIVAKSGKNVSTLYHYFPKGKKDIIKALLVTDIKQEFDKIETLMANSSERSLVDALHLFYHQFISIFYRNWYLMSIVLYYKNDFETDVTPITRSGTDRVRLLLADFLKQRVAKREIYITDCDTAAELFFSPGMENMIVNFSEPEKDIYDTREIDMLIEYWQRDVIFFDDLD